MKYLKLSAVLLAFLFISGCGTKTVDAGGSTDKTTTTKAQDVPEEQGADQDTYATAEPNSSGNYPEGGFMPVPGDQGGSYQDGSGIGNSEDDNVDNRMATVGDGSDGSGDEYDNNGEDLYSDNAGSGSDSGVDIGDLDSLATIYFDFDKFNIRDDMSPYIKANAKYIKDNEIKSVVLQGNTDEFGTDEYNFALGQKRALAVQNALVLQGLPRNMFSTISFGASKPVCKEKTSECYAKNRRTDLIDK